jgi:uncharacterized protein involved in exopolysaccharide biosynthesis
MSSPTQPTPDDEISLLDILVVLAENFWLLVLAPLAIGAITFGIVSFLPKTYESVAILKPLTFYDQFGNLTGETAPIMTARLSSSEVQARAFAQVPDLKHGSFRVRIDSSSGLVVVNTSASKADEARALAQSLINSYVEAARPQEVARQQIVERITISQNALAVLDQAIKLISGVNLETGSVESDVVRKPASRSTLADLVAQKVAKETQILELQKSLSVTMQDIVFQSPTLEEKPIRPKRLQLTAVATILSGLALTVFVLIRAGLRAAAHDPEGADKLTRIRKGVLLF